MFSGVAIGLHGIHTPSESCGRVAGAEIPKPGWEERDSCQQKQRELLMFFFLTAVQILV